MKRLLSKILLVIITVNCLSGLSIGWAEEEPTPNQDIIVEIPDESDEEMSGEPVGEPTEAPVEEPTKEPAEEPTEEPEEESDEVPEGETTEEPEEESAEAPEEEPTEEPVEEPSVEPEEEPEEEPTGEPVEEPSVEPEEEPTEEPVEEPSVEHEEEPAGEPDADITEEPTVEPTVEPTDEPAVESTEEPDDEVIGDSTEEPGEESTAEPFVENTGEPSAEPGMEPTPELTTEPAPETTIEPVPEPVPAPTAEPVLDPMLGSVEAADADATIAPTEEASAEPTLEPVTTLYDELAAAASNTIMGGKVVYEWFTDSINYVGGVIAHIKPDIMLMSLEEELSYAYVTLNSPMLEVGESAHFSVDVEGGVEPYSFFYRLYRQDKSDTGSVFWSVSGSVLNTTDDDYYFTIPSEGRYVLQVLITDATGDTIIIQSNRYETPSEELRSKVSQVVSQCAGSGLSDYRKALNLHDWLCDNAEFDYSYSEYDPEGVLLDGKGVCQSFALAYQMLLTEAGVENTYVRGTGNGVGHAWNMVKLDGDWYHVDVSWDEDDAKRYYFGMSTELIERDHTISSYVPEATATKYNYALNAADGAFTSLSQLGALLDALPGSQTSFTFYYLGDDVINDDYIAWFIENSAEYGLTGCTYSYSSAYTRYVGGTREVVTGPDLSITSAAFNSATVNVGDAVGITVKTSGDAQYLHMYGEGGALIQKWAASGNSSVSGTVRTWNVSYTFSEAGSRTMTFKASADGSTVGTGKSASVTVKLDIDVDSAAFNSTTVNVGDAAGITVKTSSDAQYLHMYGEGGALIQTWAASGNSTVSGRVRTWNVSYTFGEAGSRTMTFKASADGSTVGTGKTAAITVEKPADVDVDSAAFNSSIGYVNTAIGITVKTHSDALYLHMYGEGGALITTWEADGNSTVSGTVRTWNVSYSFGGAGNRKMTFKASADGSTVGTGKTAEVLVASGAPAVGQVYFSKSIAAQNETVTITVKTNSDATHLTMYSEGGAKVVTWAASGNSSVSGTVRVWTVSYAFGGTGNRTMTFKASRDGGTTMGASGSAGIKIVAVSVSSAAFDNSIGYVSTAMGITVKTTADVNYLHMYSEGGALVKTWEASGNSTVSGTVRTWTVSYAFGGAGNRVMTFKTSVDSDYLSAGVTAKVLIASGAPAVGQVYFSKSIAAKNETVTVTVKTNSDATHLIMYSENGGKVKTWEASGNSSVSGTVRVWNITYAFSGAGARTMTFKASRDGGTTVGVSNSADIKIVAATVNSVSFNSSIGYVNTAMGITAKTASDMKYLYMYGEGGALITKWAADGNSTVSGSTRTWNVSYSFGGAGNRKMTFKTSIDGAYIGDGVTASVLVASGAPAVGQIIFSPTTAAKGETVTITVKTNSDATHLLMYSEGGNYVKTWAASGNSSVSGTVRVWKVTYAFGGAGNRQITFKASRDGGTTVGVGNTASITIN